MPQIQQTQSFDSQIPEEEFKPTTGRELEKTVRQQMQDFSALLDAIDKRLDKKKTLWKQIYENAITDRMNCYLVFADLYINVHGKAEQHALHGMTISKYLERMSKCNDQLLKLAELVANAEMEGTDKDEDNLSEDEIYNRIGQS
jgi:hypothetical protein